MEPAVSVRNFRPSSTELESDSFGFFGTALADQIVHGHVRPPTVTLTPDEAAPMFALSSVARARSVVVPEVVGVQVYVHDAVPAARCQVAPLSVETSTPATTPPPVSVAVPETVTGAPTAAVEPFAGAVMLAVGGVVSVDLLVATRPVCRVAGWTPMSANRLTVACCMSWSTGVPALSWLASRPHDHWMVPAPNTSAPLGALYRVRLWVALPLPKLVPSSRRRSGETLYVALDMSISPAGREPLSRSSSHS